MVKRAYITPRALPDGVDPVTISVPNVPEYRAILRGILVDLADCLTWEQVAGLTIAPCDAAEWARVMLESFEES